MVAFIVSSLGQVAVSAIGFGSLHLILKKGPCYKSLSRMFQRKKDRGELAANADPDKLASQAEARIVNEVHNFAVVPLAFAALFQKKLNDDKMHGVTSYARALSLVSAGYFVADTSIVLKHFKEHGPEPLAHAIICVTFFVFSALKEKMQYWVPRTLMFECSTPLVHLRWLLHALGRSKTPFYKVNGLAMIGVFAACRIIYGTRLVWDLQVCCHRYLKNWPPKTGPGANDPISKTTCRIMAGMGCGITVLNFFWFYKMCRGAVKVFRKPSQPKQGNAQMQAPGQAPPAVGSTQPEHGAGPSAPGAQQARLGGVDARLKGLEAHGTPATAGDVAAGDDNGNGIEVIDVPDRL